MGLLVTAVRRHYLDPSCIVPATAWLLPPKLYHMVLPMLLVRMSLAWLQIIRNHYV
jgi:hypothetical protein